jgi:Fur family peroxide stress response transcriptional regulator
MDANNAEMQQRVDAFVETCRRSGIRATHQRVEVFREVARTDKHLDAETVYRRVRRRVPTVSLDTVYRTLSLLAERRFVTRVDALSDRARFDANTDPHHHFVCTRCGLVRDFVDERLDDLPVPGEVRSWGEVDSVHVQVRGVCRECRKAEKDAP